MEPRPELAAGGPCLAIPGEVYAYLVLPSPRPEGSPAPPAGANRPPVANPGRPKLGQSREIALNLNALQGPATAQWVNIWSGEKSEAAIPGPGIYQFNRPTSFGLAPGLLIVRARH
jgi:hypothetical protein